MLSVELLSLLVSIIAVAISATALIRSRKIAERQLELEQKQADLAAKQLQQIEMQEFLEKLAHVDVELEGYGSSWTLIIRNLGYSDASDVDIEWESEPLRLVGGEAERKLPIKRLKPGRDVSLKAAIHLGSPPDYKGTVRWRNSDGSLVSDEFVLHL